jgi:hypothetical protein
MIEKKNLSKYYGKGRKEGTVQMKKEMNQKKLKLSKQHKRLFMMILIILLLANIGLIINEGIKKKTTEETQVASTFSNTP